MTMTGRSRRALRLGVAFTALLLAGTALAAPAAEQVPLPPQANQTLAHDIFRDIVEVRSVHAVGTKGVADILVKYLKAGGFTDQEISYVPEKKFPWQVNVVVRLKGKGPDAAKFKPVMWICHMDVVDAKADDWTVPPFKFTEKDGYYYGRGTSDMKDEDAAAAASLIRLKQEGFV
ncbi:MAG: M20/M25/M40 family metallo-hydrolase, partial [Pseudomonadota bacterium]|nr:M20/M25/M40 family metallo-hydrolase [Pseudomonadota bacterium]